MFFFLSFFVPKTCAKEKAAQIFSFLDVNGDGKIELKEFLAGCLGDEEMVSILNTRDKRVVRNKVFYFTEEKDRKKEVKCPFESSLSIFDEIKLLD